MTPAELDRWRDELDWMENQEQAVMTDAELENIDSRAACHDVGFSVSLTEVRALVAELRQTRQRLAEAEAERERLREWAHRAMELCDTAESDHGAYAAMVEEIDRLAAGRGLGKEAMP